MCRARFHGLLQRSTTRLEVVAVRLAVGGGGARLGMRAIAVGAIRGRGRAVAAGLGLGRHGARQARSPELSWAPGAPSMPERC